MSQTARVIITTTLPNSAVAKQISAEAMQARISVAQNALQADLNSGYRVVALCEPGMRQYFQAEGVTFVKDPEMSQSMGYGRRLVFTKARRQLEAEGNKDGIIFWREPEKNLARFIPDIIQPIIKNEADIVIPRRKSLDSYPTFSQWWERTGNLISSQIIGGEEQDYWFGPRAFNLLASPYFEDYPDPQIGLPDRHDSIFGPLIDAVDDIKNPIAGVAIDFEYPREQREAEENDIKTANKRMQVMYELIKAMRDRATWIGHK